MFCETDVFARAARFRAPVCTHLETIESRQNDSSSHFPEGPSQAELKTYRHRPAQQTRDFPQGMEETEMSHTEVGQIRCACLLAFTLSFAPEAARAMETGPDITPNLSPSSPTTRDMQIVLRVRRALMKDEMLATQNVGVIVRDGVATLWGPLTSADEIRRALKTAGEVRGVQSVRCELYIAKGTRPLPPVFVLPETTTPDRAAPTDALASAGQETILTRRNRTPSHLPAPDNGPPPTPSRTALLLTPVPIDAAANEPTTVMAARTEGVPAAIDRLQKADARFGQIDAEWRDGTIVLHGKRKDASAAMAFARLLSEVPGVDRVVLHYAKTKEP
jgi:osmotically-inducible protein OsmY